MQVCTRFLENTNCCKIAGVPSSSDPCAHMHALHELPNIMMVIDEDATQTSGNATQKLGEAGPAISVSKALPWHTSEAARDRPVRGMLRPLASCHTAISEVSQIKATGAASNSQVAAAGVLPMRQHDAVATTGDHQAAVKQQCGTNTCCCYNLLRRATYTCSGLTHKHWYAVILTACNTGLQVAT